nr:sigma factor-like helix-turn-helix DNA-binding protein [uncultured Flavobacterium sp.]
MLTNTLIDRTNRFYIEISRKVLSEKEYDILRKLLIEKMSLKEVGDNYGVTGESVRRLYERTFEKVKSVTELLADIDLYKQKLEQLKHDFEYETGRIKKRRTKPETDLNKLLYDSHFPFSKRMYTIIESLGISTIGELADIPLKDFQCFRGFKVKCKNELIAFIEFEHIEHLFKGFSVWKTLSIK